MELKNISACVSLLLVLHLSLIEAWSAPPAMLRIRIVEGEGATNNMRQRTAREPIVQVVDENDRPVSGATVLFLLPDKGPGGVFADGTNQLKLVTDEKGRATARGFTPNNEAGAFRIQVQASYLDRTAATVIHQANVAATAAISAKLLALLAIGGGAAATAALARGRGNEPSAPQQPPAPAPQSGTAVFAATPTVGGAR
jgi:hypothetical protein